MKHIFIVNPNSGNGKGLIAGKVIKDYCDSLDIDYEVFYSENTIDPIKYTSSFRSKDNIVYSVGGDGTINSVVNAIANTDAKLEIIPVGTGNDFYRTIKNFRYDKIDLGKVNDKYFLNVASLGFDANIADLANTYKEKKLPNKLVYILSLIYNYFKYKPFSLTIEEENKLLTMVTICNARYYGGGFNIAPHADLNDGLFDVFEIDKLTKLQIIPVLLKLINGTHEVDESVNFYRTNKLKVESIIPLSCNIDGEIIKGNSFEFSIKKDVIKMNLNDEIGIQKVLKSKKLIK